MEAKRIAATLLLVLALVLRAGAWNVVADPWTTAQVTANAAAQKLIEEKHNARLDTISRKQQQLMAYSAAMASIRELYQLSLQNITGFGEESAYYREIFSCAADVLTAVPTVLKSLARNPGRNYLLCVGEMTDVLLETEGLVHDFKDIVNNGKIHIPKTEVFSRNMPDGGGRYSMGKGDGYNLLDRYERLTLANRIYSRMLELKYRMDAMIMLCQYSSWSDVLFAIDPETWAAYFTASQAVNDIIDNWNTLGI
jgi:hypothetical protein